MKSAQEPSRTELQVAAGRRRAGRAVLVAWVALALAGCAPAASGPAVRAPSAGPTARSGSVEAYRAGSARQRTQGLLKLPGARTPALVAYDVVDGMAVMEGDILLGPASQVPLRYGPSLFGGQNGQASQGGGFHAVTTNDNGHLWPGGSIPFVIDSSVSPETVSSIQWAIAEAGTTAIKLRPRLPTDADFVVFSDTGDGCTSYVGRIGGAQTISVTGCGRGSVLHEVLHAAGFFHEQSRSDRDAFVTIVWSEIEPSQRDAFETRPGVSQDVGAYDYGSIMHYSDHAFSRTGQATIIPRTPGVTIGQREGLSPSDRAAIATLYGAGGGPATSPIPPGPAQPPTQGGWASWWPFPTDGTAPPLPAGWPALPTFPTDGSLPALPAIPTTLPPGWTLPVP